MTTFTSLPTFRSSTSVPPGTPPPSPPPGGPTGPQPSGPGRALIADVERHLAIPLAILAASILDDDHAPAVRASLNAAANHISCALTRLARVSTPLVVSEEGPAPGSVVHGGAAGERPGAGFHLREGVHRPIGRVDGAP